MSQTIEALFLNLSAVSYRITSPATPDYNCIVWAVADDTLWWWPDPFGDYHWPPNVPRMETLDAFAQAYAALGYQPCSDITLEPGFEKIAVYVDAQGTPNHAARQLASGA